jgi:hypothetical protein
MKSAILLGDFHCGSYYGLTPPKWRSGYNKKLSKLQGVMYDFYLETISDMTKRCKPSIVLLNGDMIDGRGKKGGGSEQIVTDEIKQIDMAIESCADMEAITGCKKYEVTYGTGYHTGDVNDFEDILAKELGVEARGNSYFKLNKKTFHAVHHSGRSGVPGAYGLDAIMKASVQARLDVQKGEVPFCDVEVRSHVHYYRMDQNSMVTCLQLPALQFPGTKYGRRCTGEYDVGMVQVVVLDSGQVQVYPYFLQGVSKPKVIEYA